jgi:hypothetical protein
VSSHPVSGEKLITKLARFGLNENWAFIVEENARRIIVRVSVENLNLCMLDILISVKKEKFRESS